MKNKRVKKVFKTDEVAHLWASQSLEYGRNPQGNIYFRGTEIFSYGSHYMLGKIYTIKGQKVAVINNAGYSHTTSKHIYNAKSATSHMLRICISGSPSSLGNVRDGLQIAGDDLCEEYYSYFSKLKESRWYSGRDKFNDFEKNVVEYNQACELFGFKKLKIKLSPIHRELYLEKSAELKARAEYLNTPKMLEKRAKAKALRDAARSEAERIQREAWEAERLKRQLEHEAKLKELEASRPEAIETWKNGGELRWDLRELDSEIIRVYESEVQTSAGASVPLNEAIELLSKIKAGTARKGTKVGYYEFTAVKDGLAIIGCHKISLKEAESVLLKTSFQLIQGGLK